MKNINHARFSSGKLPLLGSSMSISHACRLRDEARAKQQEVEALSAELTTVNAAVATKGRALTAAQASIDALTHRALTAEGMLHRSVWPGDAEQMAVSIDHWHLKSY